MSPPVLVFCKDLGSSSTHKWNWECGSGFSSSKQKKLILSLQPVPKVRSNLDLIFLTWTGRSSSSHLQTRVPAQHYFKLSNWSVESDPSKGSNLSTWSDPSDPVLWSWMWRLRLESETKEERERERERRWGSTCSSSSNLYFPGSSNNCLQFGTFALLHSSPCQILFLLLAFGGILGGPEGKERWEAGLR